MMKGEKKKAVEEGAGRETSLPFSGGTTHYSIGIFISLARYDFENMF